MKKLAKFMSLALLSVALFSCGGDDDETDYTLYDKSAFTNAPLTGSVEVYLTIGNKVIYPSGTATTSFVEGTDKSKLSMFVTPPAEIGGPIITSNFKKSTDDTYYTFDVETYQPSEKTGGQIPAYITSFYSANFEVTKIIITNLKTSDVKYEKAAKSLSYKMTGDLEVFATVDGKYESAAKNTIVYTFKGLK